MEKNFVIKLETGETLNGVSYLVEDATRNLTIITGMQEYARRYKNFASKMNKEKINVFVLDAFGQGDNVSEVEELQIWPEDAFKKNVDGIAKMIELAKENKLPTYHMGHSMGSFMTQSLLERYPLIANGVILCGSNGGQGSLMSAGYLLSKKSGRNPRKRDLPNPFLTNLSLGGYSKAVKNRKTDLDWLSFDEENVKKYIADPYCGHPNTSGFWYEFMKGMKDIWKSKNLRKIDVNEKILIIAGAEDPVGRNGKGPAWLKKKYTSLGLQKVDLKIYQNMRHEILNEKDSHLVEKDILAFINN